MSDWQQEGEAGEGQEGGTGTEMEEGGGTPGMTDDGGRSKQEDLRDDVSAEPDDESWQMGDPPEEGKEGEQQDSRFEERGGQGG